ncbi:MAG TPA: hypothetical protein PLV95_01370 [Candidatus Pacearchaeota archaeon]|nr:hypothetical protein [Candidatus Pacearchaeota archaeon]
MNQRELAKFLSGFFCALTIVHLIILLGGWLPLKMAGFVFNSSWWTITLLICLSLSMVFAFSGWGSTEGKRISSSAFFAFLLVVFGTTFYLLEDYKKDSLAAIVDVKKEEFTALEIKPEDLASAGKKTFAFSFGSDKDDSGKALVLDMDNNIVMAGYFQGTIDLDPGTGTLERTSLGGSINENATDIFLAKYTNGGRLIWGFALGSVGADAPNSLKVDNEGNIYLAGYFGGQMDVDPSPEEKLINSGTGRDGFLIKYDKNGNLLWAKSFGNIETIPFTFNDPRFEEGVDLDIDADNNVYLTGFFDGAINFDGSEGNKTGDTLVSNSKSAFLVKFNSEGKLLKAISFSGDGTSQGQAVKVSKEGNVYLAGFFDGVLKAGEITLSSAGAADIFLACYDKNLNLSWIKRWGSSGNDKINPAAIDLDADSNVYLAGEFSGTVYFSDFKITSKGNVDGFFVKLNKEGKPLLIKSIGGAYLESFQKIKLDKDNNILIAGYFKDVVDFDPGKSVYFLQSLSFGEGTDAFLAKYSSQGEFIWARSIGGYATLADELQSVYGLAIDNENSPIITGRFYDQINFHSGEDLNLTSLGKGDAFLIKYNAEGEIF